jgi:hypothetical protein
MNRQTGRWIDGQTDKFTDGQTELKPQLNDGLIYEQMDTQTEILG